MKHTLRQQFPQTRDTLQAPTQGDIRKEPNFRRATAAFVRSQAGDIARAFLSRAEELGIVTEQSRFMCQRSPLVEGAYPSPPNWHIDRMPGTKFNLQEHVAQPIRGAIACVCSNDAIATTGFLSDGELTLDEPCMTDAVHKPNQYLQDDKGVMNWTTNQVNEQLERGEVSQQSINPNTVYEYDSRHFHRAPRFVQTGGERIVMRVNTPPSNFPHAIDPIDELLPDRKFYFTLSSDGQSWQRHEL